MCQLKCKVYIGTCAHIFVHMFETHLFTQDTWKVQSSDHSIHIDWTVCAASHLIAVALALSLLSCNCIRISCKRCRCITQRVTVGRVFVMCCRSFALFCVPLCLVHIKVPLVRTGRKVEGENISPIEEATFVVPCGHATAMSCVSLSILYGLICLLFLNRCSHSCPADECCDCARAGDKNSTRREKKIA